MENNKELKNNWFDIEGVNEIDSPALVIYRLRVAENIQTALSMVTNTACLRPHVKTCKSIEAIQLLLHAGINKFKCATIAEAEMLAMAGAADVLLAYQPSVPKLKRFIDLIKNYPFTKFSCLVDNIISVKNIGSFAYAGKTIVNVYIDLNVGMNRTGITPGDKAVELYKKCKTINGIEPTGLHAYDGHINHPDLQQRERECNKAFEQVQRLQSLLGEHGFAEPIIVAGGSASFPIHAKRKNVECSPGTFIYWDKNYYDSFKEQHFVPAALVISRVISLPSATMICLDLGHKSVASESALDKRVYFLNAPDLQLISQSEEHLVAEAPANHSYKIGDILYGLPYHICPTVALYERASIVEENKVTGEWKAIARDRKIIV